MYEAGFNYLLQNEKIIYGVLKKLHFERRNANFEDLVEEGKLAFVVAYEDYVAKNSVLDPSKLNAFIYQKVKWRLLDVLRRECTLLKRNVYADNETWLLTLRDAHVSPEEQLIAKETLVTVSRQCSAKERKWLVLYLTTDLSPTEIAKKLHVSRKTVYKYRNNVFGYFNGYNFSGENI